MAKPEGLTSHLARLARGVAALAGLATLLGGLPYALVRFVGWPLPRTAPSWEQLRAVLTAPLSNQILINILACLCWLLWAILVASALAETVAALRGARAPRIPLAAPLQPLVAVLVGAVVVAFLPSTGRADTPPTPALAVELTAATSSASVDTGASAPTAPLRDPAPVRDSDRQSAGDTRHARRLTYTVERGDTLWDIAGARLGDPHRWPEIYRLNQGRPQPDGRALTDPDLIYPGWKLLLPRPADQQNPAHPDGSADDPGRGSEGPSPQRETAGPQPERSQNGSAVSSGAPSGRERALPDTGAPTDEAQEAPQRQAPRTSAPHADDADRGPDSADPPPVLQLPSGAYVGISFAAAISAALAAARLHRRRRRVPPPPGSPPAPADPPPATLVRDLRRAHLDWLGSHDQTGERAGVPAAGDTPGPQSADGEDSDPTSQTPILEPPGRLLLGQRDGHEVRVDVAEAGGLGLTGPAADDVVRAAMVGLLAHNPHQRVEVVTTGDDARRLLPPGGEDPARPDIPGLAVASDLPDALAQMESEFVHRARLLQDVHADGITQLRREAPGEPLPSLLLVATTPDAQTSGRVRAVLGLGQTYDITGLLLGSWPHGLTCHVDPEGNAAPGDRDSPLAGARLFRLSESEAGQLLPLVHAAHGHPASPDDDAPAPATEAAPAATFPTDAGTPETSKLRHEAHRTEESEETQEQARRGPVRITVLGHPTIHAHDEPITTGLRQSARDLLTYLVVHPDGARVESIFDALWPEADPQRHIERFRTALRNARKTLREATGSREPSFLIYAGGRYRPDPQLIAADLWEFHQALDAAARTGDEKAAWLQRAVDSYGGELLDGQDHTWIEPLRESVRRRAADAASQLAQLVEDADPERALAHLDWAIGLDPYAEEVYCRVMRLQAQIGRLDAVRRTYQLLQTRLTELDAEPSENTARLLARLRQPTTPRDAPSR